MKTFVTFGVGHMHWVGDKFFDVDFIAIIHHEEEGEGRDLAFKYFGTKFCTTYTEEEWFKGKMNSFPRGFVDVNN